MVGSATDIYNTLEPLYSNYDRIIFKKKTLGYEVHFIDEFIEKLLTEVCDRVITFIVIITFVVAVIMNTITAECQELVCDIALPHLQTRAKLEKAGCSLLSFASASVKYVVFPNFMFL